jgi:EF-P beta-lysylation protein EpmB
MPSKPVMIPLPQSALESAPWQRELANAVSDPHELLDLLAIHDPGLRAELAARSPFPLRVPRYFVGLMRRGDPGDPLLRQVLPLQAESRPVDGFVDDPVGDLAAAQGAGFLKKYHGRALLLTTAACAVHCRYCFRRHFPYSDHATARDWNQALAEVADMPDVDELILSGGDPLTLSDARLEALFDAAAAMPQLRRLRVHTRLPVVLPARVTDRLGRMLRDSRLQTVVVLHANHPDEVTPRLADALQVLTDGPRPPRLLNQSVLLAGVNDDAATLATLSERLFEIGVLPYYLHLLDAVAGAAHFRVPEADARALAAALRARLPGYLVPKLVQERPGAASKLPV